MMLEPNFLSRMYGLQQKINREVSLAKLTKLVYLLQRPENLKQNITKEKAVGMKVNNNLRIKKKTPF